MLMGQYVTSVNSASKAGVLRKIARSDHCRWISMPNCSRASCSGMCEFGP
jgi:hypothetical protein